MKQVRHGPEVIKRFSCSTQLCIKFGLPINIRIAILVEISGLNRQRQSFILLMNVRMPIVGILSLMSRMNYMLSEVEHKNVYNFEA